MVSSVALLAWFGMIAPVIRLTLILVLGLMQPGYSQASDYISELGAVGAPYAWLMNGLGTVSVGILLIGFCVAFWRALQPGFLVATGSLLLAIAGVAFIGVGAFPCDPGCGIESPSITMQRHIQFGTLAMFAQTLAPLSIGAAFALGTRHVKFGWISLGLGGVAIAALLTLFAQEPSFPFSGALQKTFQFATDVWVFVSALVVLRIQKAS